MNLQERQAAADDNTFPRGEVIAPTFYPQEMRRAGTVVLHHRWYWTEDSAVSVDECNLPSCSVCKTQRDRWFTINPRNQ